MPLFHLFRIIVIIIIIIIIIIKLVSVLVSPSDVAFNSISNAKVVAHNNDGKFFPCSVLSGSSLRSSYCTVESSLAYPEVLPVAPAAQ
jgi:hypothetical protein